METTQTVSEDPTALIMIITLGIFQLIALGIAIFMSHKKD